jgi:hypothetical protein
MGVLRRTSSPIWRRGVSPRVAGGNRRQNRKCLWQTDRRARRCCRRQHGWRTSGWIRYPYRLSRSATARESCARYSEIGRFISSPCPVAPLVEDRLPSVSAKPIVFGADPPKATLGSWTLINANTIVASANCSSPFPNGEVGFVEDRRASPSRAYLKLWEFFTLFGCRPRAGELCLDLGASPGGWTSVLQQLVERFQGSNHIRRLG